MRCPPNRISPESGTSAPATTLKIVVFPAPFGPISPTIAPSATSNDAPTTARRPRNDFETSWTTSNVIASAPLLEAELARKRGPDPVRQEHHDHEQHHAVEHLLHPRDLDPERRQELGDAVGEDREHCGAQDRAEQRSDPADHRAEDDLDRPADVEDVLREQVVG